LPGINVSFGYRRIKKASEFCGGFDINLIYKL